MTLLLGCAVAVPVVPGDRSPPQLAQLGDDVPGWIREGHTTNPEILRAFGTPSGETLEGPFYTRITHEGGYAAGVVVVPVAGFPAIGHAEQGVTYRTLFLTVSPGGVVQQVRLERVTCLEVSRTSEPEPCRIGMDTRLPRLGHVFSPATWRTSGKEVAGHLVVAPEAVLLFDLDTRSGGTVLFRLPYTELQFAEAAGSQVRLHRQDGSTEAVELRFGSSYAAKVAEAAAQRIAQCSAAPGCGRSGATAAGR